MTMSRRRVALALAWPEGSVEGLRARGGFTVDINWHKGKLTGATIKSNAPGAITVRCGDETWQRELSAGHSVTLKP